MRSPDGLPTSDGGLKFDPQVDPQTQRKRADPSGKFARHQIQKRLPAGPSGPPVVVQFSRVSTSNSTAARPSLAEGPGVVRFCGVLASSTVRASQAATGRVSCRDRD